MKTMIDLLRGLAVSVVMTLASAAAFGGNPILGLIFGAACLAVSVFLLYSDDRKQHRIRSIAAILGYLPAVFGLGRLGLYDFAFALINPEYIREYGGPWIGDAFGLVYVYLPAAGVMLLLAVLISRKPTDKEQPQNGIRTAFLSISSLILMFFWFIFSWVGASGNR